MVYNISGAFFDSSEVVVGTNKSEKKKGENKKRKGEKGNEEEVKKSLLDGIFAAAGMIIRSVNLGSQCN